MSEPPPKRPRGRPRREGADEDILATTLALLRQRGYRDLSVDAVAERIGVAKTTVYRRWPSKGALVAAAVTPLTAIHNEPVDTGSLERDLTLLLTEVCELFRGELGPIAAALIAETHSDPDIIDVVKSVIATRGERLRDAIARGIARGELRADVDVPLLIDVLVGPLWTRLLVTGAPLDDLAPQIVRTVLHGVGTTGG